MCEFDKRIMSQREHISKHLVQLSSLAHSQHQLSIKEQFNAYNTGRETLQLMAEHPEPGDGAVREWLEPFVAELQSQLRPTTTS